MEMTFGMELKLKDGAQVAPSLQRRFTEKPVFLIGWNDCAYAITHERGSYDMDFFTGQPSDIFNPA